MNNPYDDNMEISSISGSEYDDSETTTFSFEDEHPILQVPLIHDRDIFRDDNNNPILFNIALGDSDNINVTPRYQVRRLPYDYVDSETPIYIPHFEDLNDFKTNFLNVYYSRDESGIYKYNKLKRLYNKVKNNPQYPSDIEKIDVIFFGLIDSEKEKMRNHVISNNVIPMIFDNISDDKDLQTMNDYILRHNFSPNSRNYGTSSPQFISQSFEPGSDSDESTPNGGGNKKRKWSAKYKRSINCKRPRGFSQRQYCKYGRNKNTKRKHQKKKKETKKGTGKSTRKHKSNKTKRRHK